MTKEEKIFLRFEGCSEEKIEQIEREKDYFLLEGQEPYYFMQGYEIAERKYIEQIEKMKNCLNCRFEYPLMDECNGCGEDYKHWELAE